MGNTFKSMETWAIVNNPKGIELHGSEFVFTHDNMVSSIHLITHSVTAIAGQSSVGTTDADGTNAMFNDPFYLGVHPTEAYALIADTKNHRIRKVLLTSPFTVTTIAGNSVGSNNGDGTNAQFNFPHDVKITPDGTLAVIADRDNHLIRMMSTSSPYTVTTLAGQTTSGYAHGVGTTAQFLSPRSLVFPPILNADVYVGDSNGGIRQISVPPGAAAAKCGFNGYGNTNGACIGVAQFSDTPGGMAASELEIYFVEPATPQIRQVHVATEIATSIAGSTNGFMDGPATSAKLESAFDVALLEDEMTVLVFTDNGNNAIRALTTNDVTSSPTSSPTAASTATDSPTAQPSFASTTSSPSVSPNSDSTLQPTSDPTHAPTAGVAEHIYVHAVDIHGDGWADDVYLMVKHRNDYEDRRLSESSERTDYYSLNCACKVIRLYSASGDMSISLHRNTTEPGPRGEHVPYEWEALFTVGYSDGLSAEPFDVYGGIDTEVVIDDWNLVSSSHALDVNADAPKNKCILPKPKPIDSTSNSNTTSDDSKPPFLVNVRLVLSDSEGKAWCDDSGATHNFVCSRESNLSPNTTLPNLLTYPRYFISDADGRVLMQQGTMRVNTVKDVREVKLPREGLFVFSVSGHYGYPFPFSVNDNHRILSEDALSWDFCGKQGGINERLHFLMEHGVCKPHYIVIPDDDLSCDGEWSSAVHVSAPIKSLQASSELSAMRSGLLIGLLLVAIAGVVALSIALAAKLFRRNVTIAKRVEFTPLDSTEHI